jgi:citrate lyase subunit beta/citryl-CoA lyase
MRSMLFVPGDRPERFARAAGSGADAVILDLEDAVTAATRPQARLDVAAFLGTAARPVPLWVRINPAQGNDALPDLAAIVAAKPDGIVLPKARSGADLQQLHHWLEALEAQHGQVPGSISVLALITETASALVNAASFSSPPGRVIGYSWGAEDLAADIGASSNRATDGEFEYTFRLARSSCLLMAAAAGVAAFDTTDIEYRDVDAVGRRAQAARRDGFSGKLAIHPAQVEPIHVAFAPSDDEVRWARRVIELMNSAQGPGAAALDGKMIDRPHLRQAERIIAALGRS